MTDPLAKLEQILTEVEAFNRRRARLGWAVVGAIMLAVSALIFLAVFTAR